MFEREPFTTDRLFCPGPTPVPKPALQAGTETSVYHRSDEFYKVFKQCAELLQPIFGSRTLPIILTSSGSGAMEAAVTNLTAPGDEVVVVNGGKFGERWEKMTSAYQCRVETVRVAWGSSPEPEALLMSLRRLKKPKAIFLQANETSTGVYYPIEKLVKEIRKHFDGLIVVDAISSLGAHEIKMEEWKIDCVVAGSQKGFGIPPGLSFITLSEKAWKGLSPRPRFYFDLERERAGQAEGRSAFTPASSLIFSLQAALTLMHKTGLGRVIAHHEHLARAARAAAAGMGLSLFPKSDPSNALTTVAVPENIDGQQLIKRLRRQFGMFFAGGQDQLKGKIVRLAHLGFVSRFDLIDGIAALEFALKDEGHPFDLGAGVKEAMQVLSSPL